MKYTRMEVDRETIRDEILQYLREHRDALVLPKPGSLMDAARYWSGQTFKADRQLNRSHQRGFPEIAFIWQDEMY
ncbi:MAG: hypothetical protein M5R40_25425 [Anaerolineae bacterium]|nr:hypothetical protein [Anaerolineae bacterium]